MSILTTSIAKVLITLLAIYVLGFFLWAPIRMSGNATVISASEYVADTFYRSWIEQLPDDSAVPSLFRANTLFWCDLLPSCTVDPIIPDANRPDSLVD